MTRRIGVFGWGIVAPEAPDIGAFAQRLAREETWLAPFQGFGPSNFLVGTPRLDFSRYRDWVDERFPPSRFAQLDKKMGWPTKYALAAFIQALGQNPEVEDELCRLGEEARVIVGGGLHDIPTYHEESLRYHRAQRRWNRFWASPENNSALETHLANRRSQRTASDPSEGIPPDPGSVAAERREDAEDEWWAYWTARSPQLADYLRELATIEGLVVKGEVEAGKAALIRRQRGLIAELQRRWRAPEPPWNCVTSNALWNIGNTPASQISMLGRITGMCFAPFAACSTFGYALRLGIDAIRAGDARLVVVGAADPPPHPLTVSTFYNARVLNADGEVSLPLTGMKGTHVSGGSVIWIIGDLEHYRARGFAPLGMEPLAVGVSADADHIITPSPEGPTRAMRAACQSAGVEPAELRHWDLHATATPGDFLEVQTTLGVCPQDICFTARKGSFGHGMGAGGGWELTAQFLGYERGRIFPTAIDPEAVHPTIRALHGSFVLSGDERAAGGAAGKLSMGIGGINACVISRPLGS